MLHILLRNPLFCATCVFMLATPVQGQRKAEALRIIDQEQPGRGAVVDRKVRTIITEPSNLWAEQVQSQTTGNSTVVEDLQQMRQVDLDRVIHIADEALNDPATPPEEQPYWTTLGTACGAAWRPVRMGRSWGDPHIETYDGYKYDLQSVGEFVLTRASDGRFEVQTRQAMVNEKVSMNAACAIRMVGDRVSVEAAPLPTPFNQIIRVNGEEVDFTDEYVTPRGIIIRKGNEHDIAVFSPLGDKVLITPLNNGKYMAVVPTIVKKRGVTYSGLMGDADGDPSNDLNTSEQTMTAHEGFYTVEDLNNGAEVKNSVAKAEKTHLRNVSTRFGDRWRLTDEVSLFTYDRGRGTEYYTDLSYPREHATLSDNDPDAVKRAMKTCRNAGVDAGSLEGCMNDVLLLGDAQATEHAMAVQGPRVVKQLQDHHPGGGGRSQGSIEEHDQRIPKGDQQRTSLTRFLTWTLIGLGCDERDHGPGTDQWGSHQRT